MTSRPTAPRVPLVVHHAPGRIDDELADVVLAWLHADVAGERCPPATLVRRGRASMAAGIEAHGPISPRPAAPARDVWEIAEAALARLDRRETNTRGGAGARSCEGLEVRSE